jgi:hypothetical protein
MRSHLEQGGLAAFWDMQTSPTRPNNRFDQVAGGQHHQAARCHVMAGVHQLISPIPKTKALTCSAFFVSDMP